LIHSILAIGWADIFALGLNNDGDVFLLVLCSWREDCDVNFLPTPASDFYRQFQFKVTFGISIFLYQATSHALAHVLLGRVHTKHILMDVAANSPSRNKYYWYLCRCLAHSATLSLSRYCASASLTIAETGWLRSPAILRLADSFTSRSYARGGRVTVTFRKSLRSPCGGLGFITRAVRLIGYK
jgi:hypothetical protein